MAYKLLGKNFTPPDIKAKVTGKAKYAEDFRAEGMAYIKLLLSPVPHARISNIYVHDALKMPGVLGVLTADDLPPSEGIRQPILTNNPHYVGEQIITIAAIDEITAADALEKILDFVIDPIKSLHPHGSNAR